jgi:hypothetical protein
MTIAVVVAKRASCRKAEKPVRTSPPVPALSGILYILRVMRRWSTRIQSRQAFGGLP